MKILGLIGLLSFIITITPLAQENSDLVKDAKDAYNKGKEIKKDVDDAIDKGKKAKKIFDLMFGILPNSDGKVNNVSNMNVNYHPSLSSSVAMYDKKFYTAKNTVTNNGLTMTNEITATDRRDININLLDYNPSIFRFALCKDLTLRLHFTIGADYTMETVSYSYDEWDDAGFKVMHPMWIIQEKRDRTTYLPEASLKFTLANIGYFRWGFQSSYQFRNIE